MLSDFHNSMLCIKYFTAVIRACKYICCIWRFPLDCQWPLLSSDLFQPLTFAVNFLSFYQLLWIKNLSDCPIRNICLGNLNEVMECLKRLLMYTFTSWCTSKQMRLIFWATGIDYSDHRLSETLLLVHMHCVRLTSSLLLSSVPLMSLSPLINPIWLCMQW